MLLSNKYKNLSVKQIIEHPDFLYARFKSYGHIKGYQIYFKHDDSPTGVEQVRGISVEDWEKFGKSKDSLSPTELKQSAI